MDPAIIVRIEGQDENGRRYDCTRLRIGRAADNDVVFTHAEVSSHHAELFIVDQRLLIKDLGARNGIYLNGRRIHGDAVVDERIAVRLGPNGPRLRCQGLHADGSTMLVATPELLDPEPQSSKQFIGQETLEVALHDVRRVTMRRTLLAALLLALLLGGIVAYLFFGGQQQQQQLLREVASGAQERQELYRQLSSILSEIDRRDAALRRIAGNEALSDEERYRQQQDAEDKLRVLEQRLLSIQASLRQSPSENWSKLIGDYKYSVFLCVAINPETDSVGIGTAFLIDNKGTLATNAHVVQLLRAMHKRYVIQNETGRVFQIKRAAHNPLFVTLSSADVGLIEIDVPASAVLPPALPLATDAELFELQVGSRLGTLGFPGELQKQYLEQEDEDVFDGAVATFKQGWIGRITDYEGKIQDDTANVLIQHSASLSGGTSGSPLFTHSGQVVAISSSSMTSSFKVGSLRTRQVLSAAQIAFAVRIDELRRFMANAKMQTLP